jgi:hypothetical protein
VKAFQYGKKNQKNIGKFAIWLFSIDWHHSVLIWVANQCSITPDIVE